MIERFTAIIFPTGCIICPKKSIVFNIIKWAKATKIERKMVYINIPLVGNKAVKAKKIKIFR